MARLDFSGAAEMASSNALDETLFQLGIDSATGRDGSPNLILAHMWFNLSALRGNPDGARYRQEVAIEMTPAEIAEAQRAAREWVRSH